MATDATTAYVPGYDYDVFISYARDNDKTDPGDNSSGWVATLKDRLERLVNERLAADGKIKVFFDSGSIAPNAPLSDTLRHAATRTATLVVIFSPRYLKRPWCTQERELFVKSAAQAAEGSASGLSRIFLVHFDEVPLERRPAEFQNLLGIDFYFKHPVEGWTRELYDDDTVPTELKVTYNERLRKLRHHLAETLNSMRREAEARLSRKAVEEVVDSKKPTIFLAEPCDKISRKLRAQVESAALAEFRILPEKFYDRGADRYRAALERDLAESVLFVQILGDEGSTWTDDLPEGYEGLQWAVASEKQTPALRFRPDNLDLEEIAQENPRYQQFLTGPGIQAGDIEMFRNKVIELARQLTQPPIELESGSEATGPRVLLSFDDSDASLAEELGCEIEERSVAATLAPPSESIPVVEGEFQKLARPHRGFVAVQGKESTAQKLFERLEQLRTIFQGRKKKQDKPVCAFYLGPGHSGQVARAPFIRVIQHGDVVAFEKFINDVSQSGAAGG